MASRKFYGFPSRTEIGQACCRTCVWVRLIFVLIDNALKSFSALCGLVQPFVTLPQLEERLGHKRAI